ncbi:hypothetical protein RchiOBHm_Chr7g0243101 [Rosa chinensis]|uniref:Uncharacterized protein n=1 Tax=Rosa chinensis TaxID=74649 RepID=A0A2P6PIM8_ROSCH|nr:hypothetical protein RchiOBHm_Chr7g0243101 [Rosa chinensis]
MVILSLCIIIKNLKKNSLEPGRFVPFHLLIYLFIFYNSIYLFTNSLHDFFGQNYAHIILFQLEKLSGEIKFSLVYLCLAILSIR